MHVVSTLRYTKIKPIGVGQGMNSEVFLSHDPQIGGEVAVKEIEKARFPPSVPDFFEEAKAMFASEHPNVVAIRVASETPTHICLSMPFYKNGSLADRISTNPLRLSEIQSVGQDILMGIAAIHAAKKLHFDIKPSNVLFSDKGVAMIADFGQARSIGPTGTVTFPKMYRFGVPPEIFTAGVGAVQSDVYQAGLTLYRAANGDPWFERQRSNLVDLKQAIVNGKFPNRDQFLPHIPKRMRTVIRKALSINPLDRYSSATAFSTALGNIALSDDWATKIAANGEVEWRATRKKRPDLVVALHENGTKWDVCVHTDGGRKIACRKTDWLNSQDKTFALAHLKALFYSLG
jgi:serine/threonine protein kinase